MNLILKYDEYLKQVYPTQALVSFNDDKKTKFTLTKDKQIKQNFTGGSKKKTVSYLNEVKSNEVDDDEFEVRYIENDYNVFVFNGGSSKEFENQLRSISASRSNTSKSNTSRTNSSRSNVPQKQEPKVIYVACVCDDRIMNSLLTTLNNRYKDEIIHNKIAVLRDEKQLKSVDSNIAIVVGRNYSFLNNKISINKPKSELLFYIPNDNGSFDFAKPTFVSGNQYVYDHIKPIDYFDRNNKSIRMQNDKFINTYLDSKITQLQNLYQHKKYTKLSRTNRELFLAVDNMLKEIPKHTSPIYGGGERDDYGSPYDEEFYYEDGQFYFYE